MINNTFVFFVHHLYEYHDEYENTYLKISYMNAI